MEVGGTAMARPRQLAALHTPSCSQTIGLQAKTLTGVQRRAAGKRICTCAYVPDDTTVSTAAAANLGNWTKNPIDIAALGPRAAAGALSSFSQLQQDLERLNILIQDPRPLDQKQGELAEELKATLATYVERGALMESEVLQSIGRTLPEELKSALPLEIKDALEGGTAPAVVSSQPGAASTPLDPQPVGKSSLLNYQTDFGCVCATLKRALTSHVQHVLRRSNTAVVTCIPAAAAEMVNIRAAVEGLKDGLGRLASNESPDEVGILWLNLTERRDALSRSIKQLSPSTLSQQDTTVISAVGEASQLLAELDNLKAPA